MSVFNTLPKDRIIHETPEFFMVYDGYPVSPGHILIISQREVPDFFALNEDEKSKLTQLIDKAKDLIEENHSPTGYNIGMNCGEDAGQTVMHFHCHVIPRYTGDMENPRGGVRHCVEGKGNY